MLFIVHSSFIPYFGKSAYSQQEEILKFVLTVSVQLFMIFLYQLKKGELVVFLSWLAGSNSLYIIKPEKIFCG